MGVYGLLRIALPFWPQIAQISTPAVLGRAPSYAMGAAAEVSEARLRLHVVITWANCCWHLPLRFRQPEAAATVRRRRSVA